MIKLKLNRNKVNSWETYRFEILELAMLSTKLTGAKGAECEATGTLCVRVQRRVSFQLWKYNSSIYNETLFSDCLSIAEAEHS